MLDFAHTEEDVSAPEKHRDLPNEDYPAFVASGAMYADMEGMQESLESLEIGDFNREQSARPEPVQNAQKQPCHNDAGEWIPAKLWPVLPGRLSFAAHQDDEHTVREIRINPTAFFTSTDLQERYSPFCSDFGPVNLSVVVQFCRHLRGLLNDPRLQHRHVVYYCDDEPEQITNTIFLLSSFLLLEHGFSPDEAATIFCAVPNDMIVPFRDATNAPSTFPLSVRDCLGALKRAVQLGWLKIDAFDVDEYLQLDDPCSADMHRVCPNLFACRAPAEDDADDDEYTIPVDSQLVQFRRLGVHKLVHLNTGCSTDHHRMKEVLERGGVRHCDLFSDDATPSDALVVEFLRECRCASPVPANNAEHEEVMAVSCRTGLGKTGTMVAVYIMVDFGFSAREAIAWLRIVRPGSVLGPQQHYLERVERRIAAGTFPCAQADL